MGIESNRRTGATPVAIIGLVLALWVIIDAWWVAVFLRPPALLGVDAFIYIRAAAAWLHGADPWRAEYLGYEFAAPPPTLLPFAPLTLLPEEMATALVVLGAAAAVVATVRILRFPSYWILFPPFVNSVLSANPDAFLVLILVGTPWFVRWLAPIAKLYAIIPLIGLRDTRAFAVLAVIVVATAPILPWQSYIARFAETSATLASQSAVQYSAWGSLPLTVLCVAALALIGARRAFWLAVPAVWPSTQFHYSAIAAPVARPLLLALALSIPLPYAPVVGIVLFAAVDRLERRWVAFGRLTQPV